MYNFNNKIPILKENNKIFMIKIHNKNKITTCQRLGIQTKQTKKQIFKTEVIILYQ